MSFDQRKQLESLVGDKQYRQLVEAGATSKAVLVQALLPALRSGKTLQKALQEMSKDLIGRDIYERLQAAGIITGSDGVGQRLIEIGRLSLTFLVLLVGVVVVRGRERND
ncbi:unnamed protein product [Vitrella brassicaformis CCMP3155]|uniref:Uncharacterized protein n=2 Tax=Vitrella brassicaformis TaxID=1169539 RepID=A0A0G4FPN8_VITBC|nr:unnamed protein product [Vitrella brassicaformis CCMP3155]|mmetsp:Transcript_52444/g.131817  ORF Transcript_52444/g.131817 Transcript_52444/m.131817 type:complete len:110 (+) Transcript_52444:330-659(+)|eukprot:CEM16423.1 unnamed protein product [Vitrella brassicaformis CCMP3155]